jgi:two-component system sensor histidine kinase PhoQ
LPPPEFRSGNSAFLFDKHSRYVLHYDVLWQNVEGIEREYIFTVAEDARFVSSQVEQLQKTLRFWLLFIGVVLVFIQFAVLRWSLTPLWSIVKDLKSIEQGKKTHLTVTMLRNWKVWLAI